MGVTSLYVPYKREFEPLVLPGENIAIPTAKGVYEYYRVLYIEPVQPILVPIPLDAFERSKEKELKEVELEENQAGQWRLWLLDFVALRMRYPRATSKWTTKAQETFALPLSMAKEQVLEFYTWKREVPVVYVDNPVYEPQTARILIWGYRYAIEALARKPEKYTLFPVYSLEYVVGGVR